LLLSVHAAWRHCCRPRQERANSWSKSANMAERPQGPWLLRASRNPYMSHAARVSQRTNVSPYRGRANIFLVAGRYVTDTYLLIDKAAVEDGGTRPALFLSGYH